MLRVASIDNLSASVFRLRTPRPWGVAAFFSPARVHTLTLTECCDASLLPTAGLRELSDRVEPLGAYGIACKGAVGSVVLQTCRPVEDLLGRGLPIGVTGQSKSSRRLFIQLCRMSYGRTPVLVQLDQSPYARMLIGNDAYRAASSPQPNETIIDLSEWWYRVTGRPFVFARWVVRRGLPVSARQRVQDWLEACVAESERAEGVARMAAMNHSLFETQSDASGYYANLHHRLTQDDVNAIDYFERNWESPQCLSA